MRKVFLFWGIILFILISGVAAIIYGRILLKAEKKRADEIKKELTLPKAPAIPTLPALPAEVEIEKVPTRIEVPKPVPPLLPEVPKIPTLPEAAALPKTPPQPVGQ